VYLSLNVSVAFNINIPGLSLMTLILATNILYESIPVIFLGADL
jgi:hypothetical protein